MIKKDSYNNQDNAFRKFSIELSRKTEKRFSVIKGINKNRSKIIVIDNKKILLIYKKDYFNKFAKIHTKVCEEFNISGVGDCINVSVINKCLISNISKIILIHDDKKYIVNPKWVKSFCECHSLKKEQDKKNYYQKHRGEYYIEKELTYRFPIAKIDTFKWDMII